MKTYRLIRLPLLLSFFLGVPLFSPSAQAEPDQCTPEMAKALTDAVSNGQKLTHDMLSVATRCDSPVTSVLESHKTQTNVHLLDARLFAKIQKHGFPAYMEAIRERMESRSDETCKTIAAETTPHVVDVLAIGAGVHTGMAISAMHQENPELEVLTLEATGSTGTFDYLRDTFRVNTVEMPNHSGNLFSASPIQPNDFNLNTKKFVNASAFGDATRAVHYFGNSNAVFHQKVTQVQEVPGGKPARYKVESELQSSSPKECKKLVIYARGILIGTGFGSPLAKVNDSDSDHLIQEEHRKMIEARRTGHEASFVPGVETVDDFLHRLSLTDSNQRKDLRYLGSGDIAVVGAGDGGSIAIEALTGLTHELNPNRLKSDLKISWIGQKAKTQEEFEMGYKGINKRERYGPIGATLEDGRVNPVPGKVTKVKEVEVSGKKKYELTIQSEEGPPSTKIVDRVIFATGYQNAVPDLISNFTEGGQTQPVYIPTKKLREFAGNGKRGIPADSPFVLASGEVPGQNIWTVGNATGYTPNSKEWDSTIGGFIDILGARSAFSGSQIAKTLTDNAEKNRFTPPTVLKGNPNTTLRTGKFLLEDRILLAKRIDKFQKILALESKGEFHQVLSQFRFPQSEAPFRVRLIQEGAPIGIPHGHAKPQARRTTQYSVEISNLDMESGAKLARAISNSDGMLTCLSLMNLTASENISFEFRARADGTVAVESMKFE